MPSLPRAQLTHVGLYVTDMERMVAFYRRLLGLHVSDRGVMERERRLELYTDTPWHVAQPLRGPLDFTLDDAGIVEATRAFAYDHPGAEPVEEKRRRVAEALGLEPDRRTGSP